LVGRDVTEGACYNVDVGVHRHILVVEDDAGIRDSLAELLELEGFGVTSARDGLEGLSRLRERRPDLILLDLFMPGLDGTQFVERLRADTANSDIPVVLMTGLGPECGRAPTRVQAVLPKPFELDELLAVVRRVGPTA
jgi:CheY-like chemotaxis protein